LEGYSGADIKNIAARAAALPFMEAIAGKEPRPIAMADVLRVIDEQLPSVQAGNLVRFEGFDQNGH